MKQQSNNESINQGQFNVPIYQQPYQDDEIDLRELMKVVWDYKWLTIVMCAIAIVGSVFYALNAPEWWRAEGKMIKPEVVDIREFYTQIEEAKSVGVTGEFSSLFSPSTVFSSFIVEFNSTISKRAFLKQNSYFLTFLKKNDIELSTTGNTEEDILARQIYRKNLTNWLDNMSASKTKDSSELTVSFRADQQMASAELLNQYVDFVSHKLKVKQLDKYNLFINAFKKQLLVKINLAESRVRERYKVILTKTEYSYDIALKSGLTDYNPNTLSEDMFQINLGSKALKSKIDALKSMKDISLLDPNIGDMKITLLAIDKLKPISGRTFTPYRYVENVEPPLNRAEPKRALIVILATLLAGMVSIFIALVHYFMTKKED